MQLPGFQNTARAFITLAGYIDPTRLQFRPHPTRDVHADGEVQDYIAGQCSKDDIGLAAPLALAAGDDAFGNLG